MLSDEVRELLVRFFKELRQSPPQPPIVSLTRRGTRVDNGDGLENGWTTPPRLEFHPLCLLNGRGDQPWQPLRF